MNKVIVFMASYILFGEISWRMAGNRDLRPDLLYLLPLFCGLVIGYMLRVNRR